MNHTKSAKDILCMADGGMFAGVKRMIGMGPPETMTQKFARQDAERAAKAPPAPAPAPDAAPQLGISGYVGNSALKKREAAAGLADGGMPYRKGSIDGGKVVGPGTGISDSVPARYSAGEYVLPTDTAQAIGYDKLDAIKNATHTPVAQQKKGAVARMVNGGVEDIPRDKAPPGLPNNTVNTTEAGRNIANAISAIPGAGPTMMAARGMIGAAGIGAGAGGVMAKLAGAVAPVGVPAAAGLGLATSYNADKSVATTPVTTPSPMPAPRVPAAPQAQVNPAAANPALSQVPSQPQPNLGIVNAARQKNGVMEFSGKDISGPVTYAGNSGFKPSGAGVTSMPATAMMSASPSTDAALSAARFAAAERGDFDAVRDSYNAQGQSFNGQTKESVQTDKLRNTALSPKGTPGRLAAQKILADQMVSDTTRRGQDAQGSIANQRLAMEGQELGMKQTAAGFGNRAAVRIEALQTAYESAKPEDRAAIAEQLRVMTGKDRPTNWQAQAIAGAKNMDGSTNEGDLALYNPQTGEIRRGSQSKTAIPDAATAKTQALAALKANPANKEEINRRLAAAGYPTI